MEFFPLFPLNPPMAGCTQAYYRKKNLSKSHYVLSNSNFYSYRVLFPLSQYIFNVDFQRVISKFINLYLRTFLSS